jgi:hypothetical protein
MALLARLGEQKINFPRTGESFEEREIQSKVCFWAQKSARISTFLSKGFNFKDSNLVSWIVLSILHPLTAKTSWVTAWYSKYYASLNVPKKLRTLTLEKITLKLVYVLETCFLLNFRYCWKFLAFFLVEIQLFSAQKQTSFRWHIFHSIRTWRPTRVASKMAAKLSFQFPWSSLNRTKCELLGIYSGYKLNSPKLLVYVVWTLREWPQSK